MPDELKPEWCHRFVVWLRGNQYVRSSQSEMIRAVDTVRKVLDLLTAEERKVIIMSHGLDSLYCYETGEIAEFLQMESRRVLTLQTQALSKIKGSGLLVRPDS